MKVADIVLGTAYKVRSSYFDDTIPWTAVAWDSESGKIKVRETGAKKDREGNNYLVPPNRIMEPWDQYSAKRAAWQQQLHEASERRAGLRELSDELEDQLERVFGGTVTLTNVPGIVKIETVPAMERFIKILKIAVGHNKPW